MIINKDVLHDMYVIKGMTVAAIADELSMGKTTVLYHMDKHKIPRRDLSNALKRKPNSNQKVAKLKI